MNARPESECCEKQRGAVAVIVRAKRLLLVRRSSHVVAPGMLCFPGGTIEEGETETEALCRELQEELRVAVEPQEVLWRSTTPWGVDLVWWRADMLQGQVPTPNPAEVDSVHWTTLDEMPQRTDLLESNREFCRKVQRGEIRLFD